MPGMASALTSTSVLAGRASLKNACRAGLIFGRSAMSTSHLQDVLWSEPGAAQHPPKLGKHLLGLSMDVLTTQQPPSGIDRRNARNEQQIAKPDGVRVVTDGFAQFGQVQLVSAHGA